VVGRLAREALSPTGRGAACREALGVRWAGIEPAGHRVHIDQPDRFAAEVTGFLQAIGA